MEVNNLLVRYDRAPILRGLDLRLEAGEVVAVVGRSGVGKSTLLHAIAGLVPSEGQRQVPARLGLVFQNYAVFPWLTVRGNVAFGLHGRPAAERRAIVDSFLALVGLTDKAERYPDQLSGGQVQRVALARALATDPELLLLDEPFGALDASTREKMQAWFLDIWGVARKSALLVTHSIEEAVFLADRVTVLAGGLILKEYRVPFEHPRVEALKYTETFASLRREIRAAVEEF